MLLIYYEVDRFQILWETLPVRTCELHNNKKHSSSICSSFTFFYITDIRAYRRDRNGVQMSGPFYFSYYSLGPDSYIWNPFLNRESLEYSWSTNCRKNNLKIKNILHLLKAFSILVHQGLSLPFHMCVSCRFQDGEKVRVNLWTR